MKLLLEQDLGSYICNMDNASNVYQNDRCCLMTNVFQEKKKKKINQ